LPQCFDLPIDQLTDLTFDGGGWVRHHTSSSDGILARLLAFAHTPICENLAVSRGPVCLLEVTKPGRLMPYKKTRDYSPDEKFQEVMSALREAKPATATVRDPIMEQLKQCPDAFKVGEILGKVFDSLKYGQYEILADRLLPPAGTVIPPLA
jgi:hypothetical protein